MFVEGERGVVGKFGTLVKELLIYMYKEIERERFLCDKKKDEIDPVPCSMKMKKKYLSGESTPKFMTVKKKIISSGFLYFIKKNVT